MTTAVDGGRTPHAVIVTGHQRTGTTAFRQVIGRLDDFVDCGEICTPLRARQQSEESFFAFLNSERTNDTRLAGYTDGECWQAMERYLGHLSTRHPGKTLVLDVKYDFLHNFNSASWLFTARPLLFEFAKRKQLPVLHFTRSNLLEIYCSLQYGHVTGKWHYREGEKAALQTIRLEPTTCASWLVAAQEAVELVRGWLREQPLGLELRYEDLYESDRLSASYVRPLEDLLDRSLPVGTKSSYRKTPVDYARVVENIEEISAKLAETEFAWMISGLK